MFIYREGSFTINSAATTKWGDNYAPVGEGVEAVCSALGPITNGQVTFRYDKYLYGRLRADSLFQERNSRLKITLRNKALRYLAEFDCSRHESDDIATIIEDTVMAVYVGSDADMKKLKLYTNSTVTKRVAFRNHRLRRDD